MKEKSKAASKQNLCKMEYTLSRFQRKQKFTEDHGTDLDGYLDFKCLRGKRVWKQRFESKKKEWIKTPCLTITFLKSQNSISKQMKEFIIKTLILTIHANCPIITSPSKEGIQIRNREKIPLNRICLKFPFSTRFSTFILSFFKC